MTDSQWCAYVILAAIAWVSLSFPLAVVIGRWLKRNGWSA